MSDKDKQLRAEALVRLLENNDGRLLFAEIAADLDAAMKRVLYCNEEDLSAARGHARALHEILKKFEDAKKALTNRGNTHGAS